MFYAGLIRILSKAWCFSFSKIQYGTSSTVFISNNQFGLIHALFKSWVEIALI